MLRIAIPDETQKAHYGVTNMFLRNLCLVSKPREFYRCACCQPSRPVAVDDVTTRYPRSRLFDLCAQKMQGWISAALAPWLDWSRPILACVCMPWPACRSRTAPRYRRLSAGVVLNAAVFAQPNPTVVKTAPENRLSPAYAIQLVDAKQRSTATPKSQLPYPSALADLAPQSGDAAALAPKRKAAHQSMRR